MKQYQQKIENLTKQQQKINHLIEEAREQHNTELFKIFRRLPIHNVSPDVLIGGLQFVCNEASKNSPTMENWRLAGEKFRGKRSTQKSKSSVQKNT